MHECSCYFSKPLKSGSHIFLSQKVREWFAEVQKRLDTGSDPFQELPTGRAGGDKRGELGETSTPSEEQTSPGMGDEDDDDDAEEDDGEDTDDSEVWEPSRSVKKSLSVSED